jgi:hypothetical protein
MVQGHVEVISNRRCEGGLEGTDWNVLVGKNGLSGMNAVLYQMINRT